MGSQGLHTQKRSSANQNAIDLTTSTNVSVSGNGVVCSSTSQRKPNVLLVSQSMDQKDVDLPNVSLNTQHASLNNRDLSDEKPLVKHSNLPSSHQHRNKDNTLTSPQKHTEKRKHCDSTNSDKCKHKKRKHSHDARFEGHRISHLVKKKTYNKAEDEDNEGQEQKKSDDYVLAKLFKKSGAQIWMQFIC